MSFQRVLFSVLFIGFLCCFTSISAYRYLVIVPTIAPSHYYVGSALAKGLAGAGHQITIISPFTLNQPMQNIEEVKVNGLFEAINVDVTKVLNNYKITLVENIILLSNMGLKTTEAVFNEPQVQVLLKSNRTFDAVICEAFVNEAHFGFAEHFKAPLISYGTSGATTWNTDLVGTPSPPSYVPLVLTKYTDRMTLEQRIVNLAYLTIEYIIMNFIHLPKQVAIYRQHFPNNKQTLEETRRNTSLVLLNTHVSISFPRPYSPNMIEVGGMHISNKTQPLPVDIENFINEAEHGVIYFSLGSNLKSKDLKTEKLQIILNVFKKLKQRVLWKFEHSNLPNKPDNVFISKWFPQADILAHKNVLAFITHGGLLSTTESIYYGKPIIGMPMFSDQFMNMAIAEQNGYGVIVSYEKLTEESLGNAIEDILQNQKYTTRVRELSAYYRDQKETPLERAIYWVEHVTRHKGAKYLRSASQDLNFMEYHNLDVLFIMHGIVFVLIYLAFRISRRIKRLMDFSIYLTELKNQNKRD